MSRPVAHRRPQMMISPPHVPDADRKSAAHPLKPDAAALLRLALFALLMTGPLALLSGCMGPEDKAFYGRGWMKPSEIDQDSPPDERKPGDTSIPSHSMGPGDY
jgi:hypothetical protein